MKINCIVVDDQQASLELICDHIQQIPNLNLKYSTCNPVEALEYLENENKKIDCVFLDIQMPIINGLEFIETVKEKKGKDVPHFILVTGYGEYGAQSYDYGVLDYITKPISFKRFKIAADRLIERYTRNQSMQEEDNYFFCEVEGQKLKINFDSISYIEAQGNYVMIYSDQRKLNIYSSLNNIQSKLSVKNFIRVHKSYIVSKDHIEAVVRDEVIVKLINGTTKKLPIGATFKDSVFKSLRII